jgi:hypothetical protein
MSSSVARALLQERTLLAALAFGFALRMALFSVGAHDALKERVELVTPVTSIERVREGVFWPRRANRRTPALSFISRHWC